MVALRADMSRGPHENQIPRLNSDTLETTRQMKPRTSRDTDRRPSESRTASGSASKTIARFGSTSTAHSSRLPFAPVREIHHDMPAALTDRRFQRQQRSQPPQEHADDDRPEEEDTTCGHAEHHGERREAGVRLRDAGRQGPEPAEQAQPAEPGWEPPAEKHRDTEGRDGESEEHAEKTRQDCPTLPVNVAPSSGDFAQVVREISTGSVSCRGGDLAHQRARGVIRNPMPTSGFVPRITPCHR